MTNERIATSEDVRLVILRQHTRLEQLLDELEASAVEVLAPNALGEGSASLHAAVKLLHAHFVRHLEYEDEHLGDGERLAHHAEQRARLDGLVHDDAVFSDARTLALEAKSVVHALRRDMAEEHAKLRAVR